MKRYLAHLLADIETAARCAPEPSSYAFRSPFRDEDEEEPRNEALHVRYVRLNELFGLPADAFPPVDRLTKLQVAELLDAVEKLWRAWRVRWDCPDRLTARPRYTLMVDWMYHETISYHHDFGAEIDFCQRRTEGICPMGNGGNCFCQEVEDMARHDAEVWEEYHRMEQEPEKSSPVEDLYNWLRADQPDAFDWEMDDDRQTWQQFAAEEDALAWLYFYRPDVHAELQGEEPEPSPEDFDDFEWDDRNRDRDDDYTMPF